MLLDKTDGIIAELSRKVLLSAPLLDGARVPDWLMLMLMKTILEVLVMAWLIGVLTSLITSSAAADSEQAQSR